MGGLVPERRIDKNGVSSTRWVKQHQAIPSQKKALPPPGALKELLAQRKKLQRSFKLDYSNATIQELLAKQISRMSKENVELALRTLAENPGPRANRTVHACIGIWAGEPNFSDEWLCLSLKFAAIESVYDDHLKSPLYGGPFRGLAILSGVSASIANLHDMHLSADLNELGEDGKNEALMAGYVAACIEAHRADSNMDRSSGDDFGYVFQDHPEMIGVFTEFPERIKEMIPYVYEHGDQPSALRQYMRGDHAALSGGAL